MIAEIQRTERMAYRPGFEEALSVKDIDDNRKRNRAGFQAHREFGY